MLRKRQQKNIVSTDPRVKEITDIINNIDFDKLEDKTNIHLDNLHIVVDLDYKFNYVAGEMCRGISTDSMPVIWDNDGNAYMCDPLSSWKVRIKDIDFDFN